MGIVYSVRVVIEKTEHWSRLLVFTPDFRPF